MATHDDPRFEQLLDRTGDPAFVLDPAGDRFVAGNPAGCAMLEYTLEELLETPISRIHSGELEQLREFVGEVLRSGHGSTVMLACRTKTGRRLPTEISVWAFGTDARVLLLALLRDRSEHRAPVRGE